MKNLLLVIGPEASGTRFFTEIFSQHPMIQGTSTASQHHDIFDDIWEQLEIGKIKKAQEIFKNYQTHDYWITRRSMPHGKAQGKAAQFMKFANLRSLHKFCKQEKLELTVLVTNRSPVPHLEAWTASRASVSKSILKARQQYEASYLYLFEFFKKTNTNFFLLSLEALLLDGDLYIQSLFQLLGLPKHAVELNLNLEVNKKRYDFFQNKELEVF